MNVWIVGVEFLLGVVLIAVGGVLVFRTKERSSSRISSIGLLVGGIVALGLTWHVLFRFTTLTVGRILAPWDQWASFAPPPGAWQRRLNDFFSRDSNQYLSAVAVVGTSGLLFLVGILRTPSDNEMRARLPLAFAGTNLVFLIASFLLIFLVSDLPDLWLPQPRPRVDVGYHRTWPDVLATAALLGLLFWAQRRISTPSFWKQRSVLVAEGDE